MNNTQKEWVKATIPTLENHGVALTTHFYQRMLKHNPELKNLFNQGHQRDGRQQQALAGTVLAYAQHIDEPSVLEPVIKRIANKHVSLGIRAEHYAIVGKHLLASIQEVLGDAASAELIEAWSAAYQQLANLFIEFETQLYQQVIATEGGWTGWRPFRITDKEKESEVITSFYLQPLDGGYLPTYKPGQYISVRLFVEELGVFQPRQYSLSDIANGTYFRISVKREPASDQTPAGKVSNLLHANYNVGDIVELSAPAGDFYLQPNSHRPVVLLSAGVGITPMIAMARELQKDNDRVLYFMHSARNRQVHAFRQLGDSLIAEGAHVKFFYDQLPATQTQVEQAPFVVQQQIPSSVLSDAEYYVCGPKGFMNHYIAEIKSLGVPEQQIFAEVFGSGGL